MSPASLTFTAANWNTAQTVTVTGVDDDLDDGDIAYTIVTAAATSSDGNYNGINAADVSRSPTPTTTRPGITVTPTSGLTTTEAGGTATFTVVLDAQPTADVTVGLSSSDTTEGTVSPASLTFTAANWNTRADGDGDRRRRQPGRRRHGLQHRHGRGDEQRRRTTTGSTRPTSVVTNTDNDTAGITVTPTSGLTTTEAGGTATFTVVLDAQPTADVTIGLSSSDTTEGTVSPASLTFTTANWNTAQTVTVTGVDDDLDDGDIAYSIVTAAATSADGNYNGINPADCRVTNTDNDASGITVTPTSGLTTTEAGGTATFTVVLDAQPTADVTVGLSIQRRDRGHGPAGVADLHGGNWNTAQTVTVTGVNDDLDDGDIAYTHRHGRGDEQRTANYNGAQPGRRRGHEHRQRHVRDHGHADQRPDDDRSRRDGDVHGRAERAADGRRDDRASARATRPRARSRRPSLTFTSANWNTPQTVTVTGVDDDLDDGDIAYSIVTAAATSADGNYNGINAADVSGHQHRQRRGRHHGHADQRPDHDGSRRHGHLHRRARRAADGGRDGRAVSSSDTTEGTVVAGVVTFTAANWNTAQTVTVTGVDDDLDDGDIAYTIVTAAADEQRRATTTG